MSAERLTRLLAGIQAGRVPPDVLDWLEEGITAHLNGSGTLASCLGLKARVGKQNEHPPNTVRYERRDEAVRRMGRSLPGSSWQQAGQLACILADFGRLQTLDMRSLPSRHRIICKYLTDAYANNLPIPTSQSQLARILQGRRD